MVVKSDTFLIHCARESAKEQGVVNPPIHRASTILFPCVKDYYKVNDGDCPGLVYGRQGTVNTLEFSRAMAMLEGGEYAFVTPTGLCAITTTLLALAKTDGHFLIVDNVYFYARDFLKHIASKMNIEVTFYDPYIGENIKDLIQPNTCLIYTESPGSATFEVQDIPAISKVAHEHHIPVIMDNTWATGLLFPSFEHGVDITIVSATKYILGHSDALLGAIICNKEFKDKIESTMYALGIYTSPDDCYNGLRGLRTMPVRLKQHAENSLKIADWLVEQPEVKRIMHPAHPQCQDYQLWARDFNGTSSVFSILLEESDDDAIGVLIDNLKYFGLGLSWGGFESLVLPMKLKSYRQHWHENGHVIRFHIGLEDPGDLIGDLEQAFAKYRESLTDGLKTPTEI